MARSGSCRGLGPTLLSLGCKTLLSLSHTSSNERYSTRWIEDINIVPVTTRTGPFFLMFIFPYNSFVTSIYPQPLPSLSNRTEQELFAPNLRSLGFESYILILYAFSFRPLFDLKERKDKMEKSGKDSCSVLFSCAIDLRE